MRNLGLIIIAVLPLLLAAYFLFLKHPPVWPDEATSFYMAKAIRQTGKINAAIYGGLPPEAVQSGLAFPPLYFILLGGWTAVWGETIEAIRFLSLGLGVIAITIFFLTVKAKFNNLTLAFWGALLLSFNVNFAYSARLGRPEILTLLLFLLSLLFWYQTGQGRKKILPASLFAALTTASHPMGIIAVASLILAVAFSPLPVKHKLLYICWTILSTILVTAGWIITTQESLPALLKAYLLASADKMSKISNLWALLISSSVWSVLLMGELVILLILIYQAFKQRKTEYFFIVTSAMIAFAWVILQKENYYALYTQPFLILAALSLTKKLRWSSLVFLLALNIYIQFFYIDSYTPRRFFWQLSSFDYHQLTSQIKNILPAKPSTIFLAAIPDPYLDLKDNPEYRLYEAIDPYYPISEEEYKKALDSSDYIIYSWFPHPLLAYYVQENTQKTINITQPDGYSLTVVELKPKNHRSGLISP